MERIAYYERTYLRTSGPVDQGPDMEVEGNLLVTDTSICDWTDGECQYGCDYNSLYPAIYNGEKSFLLTAEWNPAQGYCAEGISDTILSFEEGIETLLKQNAYGWMWKNPEEKE